MKATLNEYWLIWLSVIRFQKARPAFSQFGRACLLLGMISLTLDIIEKSPSPKIIFSLAWGLATIVATYYWIYFLVAALKLNRRPYAKLVPKTLSRTIHLFRALYLLLVINASLLFSAAYIISQNQFSVAIYGWISICVGIGMAMLSDPIFIFVKSVSIYTFRKPAKGKKMFPYYAFIGLGLVFLYLIGMEKYLLLVLENAAMLVIFAVFVTWNNIDNFTAMIASEVDGPKPLAHLHQQGQEVLVATPPMPLSIEDVIELSKADPMFDRPMSGSGFGETYILKPLTALLLSLEQPRQTPRNALFLNLLELNFRAHKVAYVVYRSFRNPVKSGLFNLNFVGFVLIFGISFYFVQLPFFVRQASDGFLLFAPLGLIPIFNLNRYANRIASTKKEQALMRLSPMLHSLSDLNRMLAQIILRHSFFIWLKWTGITLIAAALLGTPAISLMMQLALCCMSLPFLGTILIDYAADGEKQFTAVTTVMNVCLVVQLVWFMTLFAEAGGKTPYITLWLMGFILSNITLALAIISNRWRKMMAAPIAFPAGRMGAK